MTTVHAFAFFYAQFRTNHPCSCTVDLCCAIYMEQDTLSGAYRVRGINVQRLDYFFHGVPLKLLFTPHTVLRDPGFSLARPVPSTICNAAAHRGRGGQWNNSRGDGRSGRGRNYGYGGDRFGNRSGDGFSGDSKRCVLMICPSLDAVLRPKKEVSEDDRSSPIPRALLQRSTSGPDAWA